MKYSLGIDIGTVNVKLTLIDQNCQTIYTDIQKVDQGPFITVNDMLKRLGQQTPLPDIASAGFSGPATSTMTQELSWNQFSSSIAIASGVLDMYPSARTIIYAGGQTALIIELEDGLDKPWKVYSNPLCAAGTGRFMEQQAYRLGIDMDNFSAAALRFEGNAPRIAARCSVFAKSDLIHLQQKGASIEAMLYSLCESIARMITSLRKGAFHEPIYFVGGMAANKAVLKALKESISKRNQKEVNITIPENYMFVESLGLAKLSRGKPSKVELIPQEELQDKYYELPNLKDPGATPKPETGSVKESQKAFLGVDVGSTSTKAVLVNEAGKVIAKDYIMTAGQPVEAVKQVFANLVEKGAELVEIAGAGVTGSGRYLIGSLIGADLVKNEITAQVRAAQDIDPDADIIEIGGQDSKLVIKKNGVVVDYQMNKACAAGTGSFIDEMAEMLGISVKSGEFARLAFKAAYTVDLGTRCAAFMGQAITSAQQQNVPIEVIAASLSNSIAKNYLSKVVGSKKLGDNIILTGAVFYNQAVIAAFKQELAGKQITVAKHREVSGAIGAALLAKESKNQQASAFKGFQEVIDTQCNLSTFVCNSCDNNCTITRMKLPDGSQAYFGSRCDLYDASRKTQKVKTPFDDRQKLLFQHYSSDGKGPKVGIPRSLLVYDYAPLLIGFLNYLGARVILSGNTTKQTMEKAVELSYSDSCFPVKLLHGHVESLLENDFILYPCSIRLGEKEDDSNQKYACPLVQASPFIVREAIGAGKRLISPIIDFSNGEEETVNNFAKAAVEMGFNYREGKRAARAGLKAQRDFQAEARKLGEKTLESIRQSGKLGVVIISRSYMSQDSGANLGIAEKLAELGVVPIPIDFLPLEKEKPETYSDRPFWAYEGKFISATAIATRDPRLYALTLTSFGCGPDSFIIKLLEDISGTKPMGQLETDEHAAEAGMVTRLEAFVDTINEHARSMKGKNTAPPANVYRGTTSNIAPNNKLLIPNMSTHARILCAAMQHYGVDAQVLPEPEEVDMLYASEVTAGTECLPYRVTLGGFLRFCYENPGVTNVQGFMPGSYGPCRLGKYAIEQERILREAGFEMPMCSTVSNKGYRDLNLGPDFERIAWKGFVATDHLERLLWQCRPYTANAETAEDLFDNFLEKICRNIVEGKKYDYLLEEAGREFYSHVDRGLPPKPLVGINGEIFLRANRFSNNHLIRACEKAGLEVIVSPMSEWLKYITLRNIEDALQDRDIKGILTGFIKKHVQKYDEHQITRPLKNALNGREPSVEEVINISRRYLSPRCGSEAVLSLGSGIEWIKSPDFAGVISVMPHGCMPGGIVASMAEKFSTIYSKPWISLTYDGFLENNNLSKINNFAEIIRFCRESPAQTTSR